MSDPIPRRQAVGWHGKLPTVGDFATRGLDSNFVSAWDEWLSAGLARLRTLHEGQWLEAYLASPTWRFLLTPGFLQAPLNHLAWAGVVMPSVDRVGRYYPLTLALPLPAIPVDVDSQAALWSWLEALEDAAVDALQEDWSIDKLEAELSRLGLPPEPPPPAPSAYAPRDTLFAACTSSALVQDGAGRCVWYSQAELSAPRTFVSSAMDASVVKLWMND